MNNSMADLNPRNEPKKEVKDKLGNIVIPKGKKRVLNSIRMINKLLENQTIQKFCTNDLKKNKKFS